MNGLPPNSEKLYSENDWNQVTELLGRTPRGLHRVVRYHPKEKHPMVIEVIPYVEGAPFPTLYWLTCPILKKEISHIEKDGVIEQFEKEIFSPGSDFNKVLKENHQNYRDQRIKLFEKTIGDWNLMPEAMATIIKETGIGGISDFNHIKCFHLHYAHHLADKNVVGMLLDEKFQLNRFY